MEVIDQSLRQWFKIYSEQKMICIIKLEGILSKLGRVTGSAGANVLTDKNRLLERKILTNKKEQLVLITKKQEQEIVRLYTNVIADNQLPGSMTLMLLRHRD